MISGLITLIFFTYFYIGLQICPEEITNTGISVKWKKSLPGDNVISSPLCYYDGNLVTRNCTGDIWVPSAVNLQPCLQTENYYNLSGCPPGFNTISKNNSDYCYEVSDPTEWNYPCPKSGGALVITDLSDEDGLSLLNSLSSKNISRFFWLPAKRQKFLNPVVWHIPGPKWGHPVESNNFLKPRFWHLKTCLLLDIVDKTIVTETCTELYPNLCFYINDLNYPAKCPERYHSVRYLPDDGLCLGIEESDTNLTFDAFINEKCKTPMGERDSDDLTRFIFKKIAELNNISDDVWCWFASADNQESQENNENITNNQFVTINNIGTLSFMSNETLRPLPCMACQTEVIYPKTEFVFEYKEEEKLMYLTIYQPSGLWKYDQDDIGVQCFSDAKGLVRVIDMDKFPIMEIKSYDNELLDSEIIDKIVYAISLITERSAQYWCEGHTINFSLITTDKIVANPLGKEVHVFSLVIKIHMSTGDVQNNLELLQNQIIDNITYEFSAKKVVLMEYLEYSQDHLMILLHLDIDIINVYDDNAKNIQNTFNNLYRISETELLKYSYIFVNISSSIYCLPITSYDNSTMLDWELTAIGHIAAPKQFCLQENGLPVKRTCSGSYLLGSIWGHVEGTCNKNYKPSDTTTFLYKFVKGQVPKDESSRFLTDGLGFVLGDINIIIPADIYYLSISLQHILLKAEENQTNIDLGNIDNITWAMDRVMLLDNTYLRLAQTLNSTNVILDSIGGIINRIAVQKVKMAHVSKSLLSNDLESYQLAVRPKFVLQVSYPYINNISGIAVIKSSNEDSFTSMEIKPLFMNTTLTDVLSINNLEIATWLPSKVLNTLRKLTCNESYEEIDINEDVYVIVSVFYDDAIFQELDIKDYSVNSRIVGVALPPEYMSNLEEPMPLIYKDLIPMNNNKHCGYWDFQTSTIGNIPGHWSDKGCYLIESKHNLTVCECYHLTHFGQLIDFGRAKNNSNNQMQHAKSLNIISLVGSFLSLIGIMCIWITACVFQNWRKKAGTKVLLHLSTSIALPLIFMIVFNLDNTIFIQHDDHICIKSDELKIACIFLGAALHYSVLASFMWMLITAVLQFIRYVRVFGVYRPSRIMIKFALIGWGIPLIPVAIVLILNNENYLPNLSSYSNAKFTICYPTGFYFVVTVIVPICIILIINVTLFISVMCSISRGPDGKMRSADIDLIGAQLRLSIFLFFLLGLTWIFGLFSFSKNLIWSYLFCLTSTMQGFVLFVYFVICDSQTRNLWVSLMKPQFRTTSSRESVVSFSSN